MKKHTTVKQSLSSTDLSTCTTVAVDLAKQVFQIAGEMPLARCFTKNESSRVKPFIPFCANSRQP